MLVEIETKRNEADDADIRATKIACGWAGAVKRRIKHLGGGVALIQKTSSNAGKSGDNGPINGRGNKLVDVLVDRQTDGPTETNGWIHRLL